MKSKLDEILNILIEEVRRGRPLEDCLSDYAAYANELRPLVELAHEIDTLPKPKPAAEAIEVAVQKARMIVEHERRAQRRFSWRTVFSLQPAFVRAAAVVVFVAILGWTTVLVSAYSLPGEVLYPVKRFTEKARYVLTTTPEGKTELHVKFADERATELVSTFKQGEPINQELLNAMLDETQHAFECTETLTADCCTKAMASISHCNLYQIDVLKSLEPLVCECDEQAVTEALQLCMQRQTCIDCQFNNDGGSEQHRCPCID